MAKNEIMIQYTVNAKHRVREAFMLDRFHRGEISANRAARLLDVSPADLSKLMYKIKSESPILTTRSK